MPAATDFSSGELNGYGFFPVTVDPTTGLRSSSETSLLKSALGDDRLTLYINSQAMKLVFDGNKTATGVMVKQPGLNPYMLSANKEVILSAEVVNPNLNVKVLFRQS